MKDGMYSASVNMYPCMAMRSVHDMNGIIILANRNRNESRNRKSASKYNGDAYLHSFRQISSRSCHALKVPEVWAARAEMCQAGS